MKYIKKIWEECKALFKQGLSPKQLSASITVSVAISFFPIFGITTIILTLLAFKFKLNLPIMIALSYVVEPIKLLLLLPFIYIGANLWNTEHTLLTVAAIKESYEESFFNTVTALSYELLCGFTGWFVVVIPLSIGFYFGLKVLLTFFVKLRN
ncbi:DUF2062 domain-containing protein [Arenibacter sp. GZD96]|uniref:DUF2062 domain-containing protein n=1 Tax=Aurantibrevibacter litoralis TaxID=3106030 RepID=UPI002AFF5E63|nr:DUF2062 domain-containing protein [Arenibacter sp. GZD-96]MEA1786734.1 DUF2062 domain-containing protein [Arenibacter sp. GZD-96]